MNTAAEYSELQLATILKTQREIRQSPARLFKHVLKEERTHEPVVIAPHQQVALEFMHAHRRSVHIWPINHAKTTCAIAMILWKLFVNPSARIAIVSATQEQSAKLLSVVKTYIEHDEEYRLFTRDWSTGKQIVERGDKWTDTAITIKRPHGIKDPSVIAVGLGGGLPGSRLDLIIVDDILNFENTYTKDAREKVFSYVDSTVISRLEADGTVVISNSAWHPDDALHMFRRLGFASLLMQVTGEIYLKDDAGNVLENKYWDSPIIEDIPGGDKDLGERVRVLPEVQKAYEITMRRRKGLIASPDTMLWNPHPTIKSIAELRLNHPIDREFNRLYMSNCRDDGTSMCKSEWIENAKERARILGYTKMPKRRLNIDEARCFTGVDLAVSKADGRDDTSILTFEILPGGERIILDIEIGKFSGPETVRKLVDVHKKYDSVIRVENNGSQEFLLQFMREQEIGVPIRPHTTGSNKAHPQYGVATMFVELFNGHWLFPSNGAHVEPNMQRLIDACLYYAPGNHTDDALMSWWFAREQAREFGLLSTAKDNRKHSISMAVMAR